MLDRLTSLPTGEELRTRATLRRAGWQSARERRVAVAVRRRADRAVRTASAWTVATVGTPVLAVETDHWAWYVVGGLTLVKSGFSWRKVRRTRAAVAATPDVRALAVPTVLAPRLPRRSAAAAPLRRADSGLAALYGLVERLPAGPVAVSARHAVEVTADTVDAMRIEAGRVAACELAAETVGDPEQRGRMTAQVVPMARELTGAADGIDELLAAVTDALATGPASPLTGVRLAEATGALQARAAGLRDVRQ